MGSDPTSCPSIYLSCDDFMCVAAAATMLASGSATSSLLFWSECGQYAAFPSSNTFLETKHEWKFPATALSSTNQLCSIVTSSFAHIHSPLHPSTSSANLCASWRRLRKCSSSPWAPGPDCLRGCPLAAGGCEQNRRLTAEPQRSGAPACRSCPCPPPSPLGREWKPDPALSFSFPGRIVITGAPCAPARPGT